MWCWRVTFSRRCNVWWWQLVTLQCHESVLAVGGVFGDVRVPLFVTWNSSKHQHGAKQNETAVTFSVVCACVAFTLQCFVSVVASMLSLTCCLFTLKSHVHRKLHRSFVVFLCACVSYSYLLVCKREKVGRLGGGALFWSLLWRFSAKFSRQILSLT